MYRLSISSKGVRHSVMVAGVAIAFSWWYQGLTPTQ
jgi:hypothetical protein